MNLQAIKEKYQWNEKYRPQTVQDVIIPQSIKDQIKVYLKDGNCPNLLFDGPSGTGKTTLARAIANELNSTVLELNGSGSGRGIDTIREKIPQFASTQTLGGRKIILIDEADKLTQDAQDALRNTIEAYSSNVSFIFTTNRSKLLSAPIRSRFTEIDFGFNEAEKKKLMGHMLGRMVAIFKEETGNDLDKAGMTILAEIIQKHFPDNRKALSVFQQCVRGGELAAEVISQLSGGNYSELKEWLLQRKFVEVNEWVKTQPYIDHADLVEYFWNHGEENFGIKNMPAIIMAAEDYQRYVTMVANPKISTVTFLLKVMTNLKGGEG